MNIFPHSDTYYPVYIPINTSTLPIQIHPYLLMDAGYVAYIFFCFFGIGLFVHGLAVSCAGLTSSRSSLSQSAYSILAAALCTLQVYFIGYSLECSQYQWFASPFVGYLDNFMLFNLDLTDPLVVGSVILRTGFSLVPCCLLASAACQRGRMVPLLSFLFLWLCLVYCPVARWCWQPSGWSYKLGVLDYAGGTIIHISAGCAALVYSHILGPRFNYGQHENEPPFSLTMVIQGTTLMWLGWIGFTGGSQISDPADALHSVLNTCLSAAMGGFSWLIVDWCAYTSPTETTPVNLTSATLPTTISGWDSPARTVQESLQRPQSADSHTLSIVGFCSGVVSGLVAITPAAGYVHTWSAPLIGALGALGCNYATKLKFRIGVDDPLDVFAVHGVGGFIGTVLTGVFAAPRFRHGLITQIALQIFSAVVVACYSFVVTYLLATSLNRVNSLRLRITPEEEAYGLDLIETGESADTNQESRVRLPTDLNVGNDLPLLQNLPLSYGLYYENM